MVERFIRAQESVYPRALEEIKSGRKLTHWMWFIFPQIKGLGLSMNSILYSIKDIEEAREYVDHPELGARLREISRALLALPTDDPREVLGHIDAMKLRSCMTLFDAVEPESVFAEVLKKFYDGKRDARTLKILADQKSKVNGLIIDRR